MDAKDVSEYREVDDVDGLRKFCCLKCNKMFVKKQNVKAHASKCKGVSNSLECHICHKVFTDRSNKAKHVKMCIAAAQARDQPSSSTTNIAETINIHNGDVNNTTINNIVHNHQHVALIAFEDGSDSIPFNTSGIDNRVLREAMLSDDAAIPCVSFTRMVSSKPENQIVRKTNLRSTYSQVHVGNGIWQTRSDSLVYPRLTSELGNLMGDYFNANRAAIGASQRRFAYQQKIHDYLADNGYCNDDHMKEEVKRIHRKMLRETKAIMFDMTKKCSS